MPLRHCRRRRTDITPPPCTADLSVMSTPVSHVRRVHRVEAGDFSVSVSHLFSPLSLSRLSFMWVRVSF
ncbi:hypothetical protein Hanom_Chr07g00641621 [Helianthus anomalus]